MTKIQRFNKLMEKFLNPFKRDGLSLTYSFSVETVAGPLLVSLDHDASKVFSVFTCFDDADRMKKTLPNLRYEANQFSGKWNFHETVRGTDPRTVADYVIDRIKSVME